MLTSEISDRTGNTEKMVEVVNPSGSGVFLLVCEHASNFIPAELDNLGLDDRTLETHIAWDPGARAVALELSAILDSPLVASRISRLVYDCNRPPDDESAIAAKSENRAIPGNTGLTSEARTERSQRFYAPFKEAIDRVIRQKMDEGVLPVLITIHSFTPVYNGVHRDVEVGFLHDRDRRFADEIIKVATETADFNIKRNSPYGPADGVTHTLLEHALPHNLLNMMIEIRNDLIPDSESCRAMAEWISMLAKKSLTAVSYGFTNRSEAP